MGVEGRELYGCNCWYHVGYISLGFVLVRSIFFSQVDAHARRSVTDDMEEDPNTSKAQMLKLDAAKALLVKKYKKYLFHGLAYVAMLMWGIKILIAAPWSYFNT